MRNTSENGNSNRNYPVPINEQHCIQNDDAVSARTSMAPTPNPERCDAVSLLPYRSKLVTIPVTTRKHPATRNGQDPVLTSLHSTDGPQMGVDEPACRQRNTSFLDTIFVCRYRVIGRILGFFVGCVQVICTLPEIVHVGKSCHVLSRENAIFVLFTAFITVVLGLAFGLLPDLLFKLSFLLICLYQMADSIAILVSQPCENMAILTGVRFIFDSICIIALFFLWKRL